MSNFGTGMGMGMGGISGVINSIAGLMSQQAMTGAIRNQLAQQGKFQDQSMGVFSSALPNWSAQTAQEQTAAGSQHRQEVYGMVNAMPSSVNSGARGPTGRDQAATRMAGERMAGNSGYSDWQLEQMINKFKMQDELNRIASRAEGQLGLFPYQMQSAQHSGDWLGMIGGLMQGMGNGFTGMGGLSKPKTGGNGFATGLSYTD